MSSTTSPPLHRNAAPEGVRLDEWLRCPGERAALAMCIASNAVVLALAVGVYFAGAEWLGAHPLVARHSKWISALVTAALVALPAVPIGRHIAVREVRDNGVRLGEDQFPELHRELLRACRVLEIDPVPAVYLHKLGVPAIAHSAWGGTSTVVVNADLLLKRWTEGLDWLTFALAGALGAIRLGHTRWWVELLTVYARRLPGLRAPLLITWTYSRDRCAAAVVPEGIRGLLVEALGKNGVLSADVDAFLRQSEEPPSFWELAATLKRRSPPLIARARALYGAGFFDRARDWEKWRTRRSPA